MAGARSKNTPAPASIAWASPGGCKSREEFGEVPEPLKVTAAAVMGGDSASSFPL